MNNSSAHPNPATEQVTVDLSSKDGGYVVIRMLDGMGRTIAADVRTALTQGEARTITMDVTGFANGTYPMQIEQEGTTRFERFLVSH